MFVWGFKTITGREGKDSVPLTPIMIHAAFFLYFISVYFPFLCPGA